MRLLFIRHGEPDYEKDSLTEKGFREAEYLAEYLADVKIDACYVSPLGRAKDTAAPTLLKKQMTGVECQWLEEFPAKVVRPDKGFPINCWDFLPQDWTGVNEYYDKSLWAKTELMEEGNVAQIYQNVTQEFDGLLAKHGYAREGNIYRVERANRDTIAFFCHFALECVLLGHLIGASPMVLWHGFCAAPSSVTTVFTEERREGVASFRISRFGDISHLFVKGEEPSFYARYCETFDSDEKRD
ncbi:MAG: histidine phosphatase family protein [Eubacterium sp.]|jgi:broad specificity phosphatase PhoE|nr:histidine phosphatase family protein [Eubacterium sp.]